MQVSESRVLTAASLLKDATPAKPPPRCQTRPTSTAANPQPLTRQVNGATSTEQAVAGEPPTAGGMVCRGIRPPLGGSGIPVPPLPSPPCPHPGAGGEGRAGFPSPGLEGLQGLQIVRRPRARGRWHPRPRGAH